jgi:UDP:flavonoid glycosyltransferase YjiC (YdhE family)
MNASRSCRGLPLTTHELRSRMKLTIFAAGSRGDIQPCLALGKGLQAAGYAVRLAAPADFADFVGQHGLDFFPLRGDVQQIMASDTGREFMESGGGNPLKSIRAIRTLIAPVIQEMAADTYAACQDADTLICLGVFSAFGQAIVEKLRLPMIHVEPTPLLPTRAFPAPSWPIQKNLGGLHNHLSGMAMLRVVWQWYLPFVQDFRRSLGLSPANFRRYYRTFRSTPMLSAYSPGIIPHPADWPDSVHVTGYFFLDSSTAWQPSSELQAFLDAGAPPVYIGFGSMSGQNPEKLAGMVVEALAQSAQRGVLVTGWGGIRPEDLPETVFVLESAPHSWLFPHMAAVVHHGGAGTTAEGLRAGVPSVIVPFVLDQPFWGARVHAMGLGPAPIPQKHLTAEHLAQAIRIAVTDPAVKEHAARAGAAIRAEDGVSNAVRLVRRYFGEPEETGQ